MDEQTTRVWEAVNDDDEQEDIVAIIKCACELEKVLYKQKEHGSELFNLRKALEGIFGHDFPF